MIIQTDGNSLNGKLLRGDGVWITPEPDKRHLVPSEEQLEKHPTLKQAWDEYIVIRKLLGL